MLSRVFSSAVVLLAIVMQVNAHAAIAPALNAANPARSDVKRPGTGAANACGAGVNIASLFNTAQAVTATGSAFTARVTNFNGGADGSRKVTAQVDPTGTGSSFQAATVTTNGDAAPAGTGSENVTVNLPAQCQGGTAGNKCLVQFKTTAGFGNCVVVEQGAAAAVGNNANAGAGNDVAAGAGGNNATIGAGNDVAVGAGGNNATVGAGAGTGTGAGTGNGRHRGGHVKGGHRNKTAVAGSRAARAFILDVEERGEELIQVAKRSISSWIWA